MILEINGGYVLVNKGNDRQQYSTTINNRFSALVHFRWVKRSSQNGPALNHPTTGQRFGNHQRQQLRFLVIAHEPMHQVGLHATEATLNRFDSIRAGDAKTVLDSSLCPSLQGQHYAIHKPGLTKTTRSFQLMDTPASIIRVANKLIYFLPPNAMSKTGSSPFCF